jgi:SPP1 gp7 family putative phage head morphogenesis protein
MASASPPSPDRHDEAIRYWRSKVPMTDEEFAALEEEEQRKAFFVAGVTQARPLQEVFVALDDAIANGKTLEDFKAEVGPQLAEAWGGEDPARLETVFRTNVMSAYNGGRHEIFSEPEVREARPYLRFDAVGDSRMSEICEALDGKVLPADDPFWLTHTPPLHHNAVTADTMIATAAGYVRAGEIRPGMRVLSHARRWRLVTAVLHKIVKRQVLALHLATGRVLRITKEHPVLVHAPADGLLWRKAGDLKPGDHLLEHGHQMVRTESTVVVDADHAPPLLDEPSVSGEVVKPALRRPVPFPVDLDGHSLSDERQVEQVGPDGMLGDGSPAEEGEQVLLGWGEYLAEGRRPGGGSADANLSRGDGIAGEHTISVPLERGRRGGAESPCPVLLAASLGDNVRIASRDLHLVALGAHSDGMALAPSGESAIAESQLPLERSQAALCGPVLFADEGGDRAPIGDVEWHAATVLSIVVEDYAGEVCDLSVVDDETYVAGGIVVHNCRSILTALDPEEARAEGITRGRPDTGGAAPDDGFGRPPAPGDGEPDLSGFDPDLRRILQKRLE